jgi:hypothetical protein
MLLQIKVYCQISHSAKLRNHPPKNFIDEFGRQGYIFGNDSYYIDPISNKLENWNAYRSNCFEVNDNPEKCLLVLSHYVNGNMDGVFNYYNNDTILLMSGFYRDSKMHGIFSFYTHGANVFPDYDSLSTQPTRQIIYYKGKRISDISLNSDGQPIGVMKTRHCKRNW